MEYRTPLGFQEDPPNLGAGLESPEIANLNVPNWQRGKRLSLMNDLEIRGGRASMRSSEMLGVFPDDVKLKRMSIRQVEIIPEEVMLEKKVTIGKSGIDDLGIKFENQRSNDNGITLVGDSLVKVPGMEAAE
jgi:hypothetical protein